MSRFAYWGAAAVAVGMVLIVAIYFSAWRYADVPYVAPSFGAGSVGRFLLAAAALAYLVGWRYERGVFESAGGGMAAVAVIALLLSAVLRRFETVHSGLSVNVYGGAFYDPLVGFLALAVTAYLIIEWWYQDVSAGKWVIPIAAVAATVMEFQLVSLMTDDMTGVLRGYWHCTAVLLSVIAYMLLGFGCLLALTGLLRNVWGWPVSSALPILDAGKLEWWMVRSNLCGFGLLIAAALLWEGWAAAVPRSAWFVSPVEPWVFATALLYGGHFVLLRLLRPALAKTAFWVVGIYLTSLSAFVGIHTGMS